MGSDEAGKVMLGTGVTTCTLGFQAPWPNAPACVAVNETNGGGRAAVVGVRTTTTALVSDGIVL